MSRLEKFGAVGCRIGSVGTIPRPSRSGRQDISVLALLEWAFAREHASISFDDDLPSAPSVGIEYVMIRQAELGCRIDGGGHSPCHPDAERLAGRLASLPSALGGSRMALRIAELARAGRHEDWFPNPRPRCEPREWGKRTRFGRHAKTEVISRIDYKVRGRTRSVDVLACPVVYRDTAREIAQVRRQYTLWCLALSEVRSWGGYECWNVTDDMPPIAPWIGG